MSEILPENARRVSDAGLPVVRPARRRPAGSESVNEPGTRAPRWGASAGAASLPPTSTQAGRGPASIAITFKSPLAFRDDAAGPTHQPVTGSVAQIAADLEVLDRVAPEVRPRVK